MLAPPGSHITHKHHHKVTPAVSPSISPASSLQQFLSPPQISPSTSRHSTSPSSSKHASPKSSHHHEYVQDTPHSLLFENLHGIHHSRIHETPVFMKEQKSYAHMRHSVSHYYDAQRSELMPIEENRQLALSHSEEWRRRDATPEQTPVYDISGIYDNTTKYDIKRV